MTVYYIQLYSDYEVYIDVQVYAVAIFCRKIAKTMNFLQRNSSKLANYLYNVKNFLVLLRIQLNFYIIGRKSAEEEKKNEEK